MPLKYACFLILFIISISSCANISKKKSEVCVYQLLDDIEWDHFRWVNAKYQLVPYLQGGDIPDGGINIASASLRGDIPITVNEARIIFLDCIDDLLRRMNKNKEIRPYLLNYPCTYANIRYSISFDDLKRETYPPFVSNTHMFRENIDYSMLNEQTRKPEVFLQESYEQAIEKAAAANRNGGSTTPLPS